MTLVNIEVLEKENAGGIIYKATNKVNGKVYVGLTKRSLKSRIMQHLRDAEGERYAHLYFYRAIRKHGEECFVWNIIDEGETVAELCEKEIYWIDYYNSYGEGGYNLTTGGEGVSGLKRSDEYRDEKSKLMISMWENGHTKTILRGSQLPSAIIKEDDVLEIRNLILNRTPKEEIAEKYGITVGNIYAIKAGKKWRHIITEEDVKAMALIQYKLNSNDAIAIKDMIIEGSKTISEIASIFDVDKSVISRLKIGVVWNSVISEEDLRKMEEARPTKRKKALTQDEVLEVKDLLISGFLKQKEIAKAYQATAYSISRIIKGESHSDIITEVDRLKMKKTIKEISKAEKVYVEKEYEAGEERISIER